MTNIPAVLLGCDEPARALILRALPAPYAQRLNTSFPEWAHEGQSPPPGDWRVWVMLAGRGFGKTRAGAEWVLSCVRAAEKSAVHIALVAATLDEARRIMIEGPSGLIACALPGEIVDWSAARRALRFASGAEVTLYSGASPESLRGPAHDFAWCDELAKWDKPQATWDNLQLGLRRGVCPRVLVTTTPRPGPVLTRILDQTGVVQTRGTTRANPYLPTAFIAAVERQYVGTRWGAQELDGVLFSDVEGSLWPAALIARTRVGVIPDCHRIVIGVDPPASANGTCGIVVCGLAASGKAYVLADASVSGQSPEGWARAVAAACETWGAAQIIVEKNQGGDMAAAVLRGANAALPLAMEHASKSKVARAEPVAALFERGEAYFAGAFPALEAELAGLVAGGGYHGPGHSPDRADACVWALWALKHKTRPDPHIRAL